MNQREVQRVAKNTPMVFGKAPQFVIDEHYRQILETLKAGNPESISFLLACINYLKDRPGYGHIQFAAQKAVMHGWLTVNDANQYVLKVSEV